jgi:hypothetical protein
MNLDSELFTTLHATDETRYRFGTGPSSLCLVCDVKSENKPDLPTLDTLS